MEEFQEINKRGETSNLYHNKFVQKDQKLDNAQKKQYDGNKITD